MRSSTRARPALATAKCVDEQFIQESPIPFRPKPVLNKESRDCEQLRKFPISWQKSPARQGREWLVLILLFGHVPLFPTNSFIHLWSFISKMFNETLQHTPHFCLLQNKNGFIKIWQKWLSFTNSRTFFYFLFFLYFLLLLRCSFLVKRYRFICWSLNKYSYCYYKTSRNNRCDNRTELEMKSTQVQVVTQSCTKMSELIALQLICNKVRDLGENWWTDKYLRRNKTMSVDKSQENK